MCGCAKRMREVLPEQGYELRRGTWVRGKDHIRDSEIEDHHFRLVLERPDLWPAATVAAARAARARILELITLLE